MSILIEVLNLRLKFQEINTFTVLFPFKKEINKISFTFYNPLSRSPCLNQQDLSLMHLTYRLYNNA